MTFLGPSRLIRRARVDRERMNGSREFCRKKRIDAPVAVEAAQPRKSARNDLHPEVGLAFGSRARMAGVQMAFVDHLQPLRLQRLVQNVLDPGAYAHDEISFGLRRGHDGRGDMRQGLARANRLARMRLFGPVGAPIMVA